MASKEDGAQEGSKGKRDDEEVEEGGDDTVTQ